MHLHRRWRMYLTAGAMTLLLAACGSVPKAPTVEPATARPAPSTVSKDAARTVPVLPPAGSGRGGYYQDDGPGENPPEGLHATPDAEPRVEPYSAKGNRPYVVFGKTYTPITDDRPFKQRGVGSWYGKKFHGQKTSSGEPYDMYKMTAAHPTLPIPSYARVTNLDNGVQIIVRVNDRGPFHSSRIIDLSYTAALKLGYLGKGSGQLEIERLLPDEIARINSNKQNPPEMSPEAAPMLAATEATGAPAAQPGFTLPSLISSATAAPVAPIAPTAAPAQQSGFYVQLGAYTQATNAEAARIRLLQNWAPGLPPIEVAPYGVFYRLYGGPFATRAEAAAAAQQVQTAGASKPVIVQR